MVLLLPMGVLLTHLAAYALPHAEPMGPGSDHHHIAGLAAVAALGLVCAVLAAVAHALRGRATSADLRLLSIAQCAGYVTWELGEGLLAGDRLVTSLSEPTLLTGLVLQFGVALVLAWILRASAAVGRRLASTPRPVPPRARRPLATPVATPTCRPRFSPASRRGPPALLLP